MRHIIYVFLALLFLCCEEYDPTSGTPETVIQDFYIDNSTIILSWLGNEFSSDFSYRLEPLDYTEIVGLDTAWSSWSSDTSVTLAYLDEGSYNFYVKSRLNIDTEEDSSDMISFTIDAVTGPALRMYPLHQQVSSGSSCSLYIYVEDVVDLMSFQIDVSYNTEAIADLSINAANLLSNSTTFFTEPEYSAGVMRITTTPENFISINGGGAVAKLTFTSTVSDTLHFLQNSIFKDSLNATIEILERVEGIIVLVE